MRKFPMHYKQFLINLLARAMTIAQEKKPFLVPAAAISFAGIIIISPLKVSKYLWFGVVLPGKLILLFLCFILLLLYILQSKNLLRKKMSLAPGKAVLVVFLGIILLGYLVNSFGLNKGLYDYVIGWGPDATAHFTQAKILAAGHINVPSHELKEFFQTGYCIDDGKYYGMYPPGWAAILSLGILLKLPWIVNPLLTVLALGMIHLLGRTLYDDETAWIGTILAGFSPMVILWSSYSYFSESTALLFSVLFFYGAVRSLESPHLRFPVIAGICLGIVFLTRPYTAVALAFPMCVYWLVQIAKHPRLLWRGALLILAFLPLFALHFVYNYYQTGSPWLLPLVYYNPLNKPGFGFRSLDPSIKPFYFGPLYAMLNLALNLLTLNWSGLPLLFLFILFALIGQRRKWDLLLSFTSISMIGFHVFYFARSNSRFYYPAFFAIFLLAARGIVEFERLPEEHLHIEFSGGLKIFCVLFLVISSFILISLPGAITNVKNQTVLFDPFLQVKKQKMANSIIFLKTVPEVWNNISSYIQNSPDFDDSVLFVRDLGPQNTLLMEYYPDRKYYRYEFDRKTQAGKFTPITSTSY